MNSKMADALRTGLFLGASGIEKASTAKNPFLRSMIGEEAEGWIVCGFPTAKDLEGYFDWLDKNGYGVVIDDDYIFVYLVEEKPEPLRISIGLWTATQKQSIGMLQRLVIEHGYDNTAFARIESGERNHFQYRIELTQSLPFLHHVDGVGFDDTKLQGIVDSLQEHDNMKRIQATLPKY
jgi:hypothetical protein